MCFKHLTFEVNDVLGARSRYFVLLFFYFLFFLSLHLNTSIVEVCFHYLRIL